MSSQFTNVSIANITNVVTGDVLLLSDGFVGTNASIGLVTTLNRYKLPTWDGLYVSGESSFYSEFKVVGNVTNVAKVYPDSRQIITVAPIFVNSTACNTGTTPRDSSCANAIQGWAYVSASSLCRDLSMSMCAIDASPLSLLPSYGCRSNQGLCAKVGSPPDDDTVIQLMKRFSANNWTTSNSTIWLNVNSLSSCDMDTESCIANYETIGMIGLAFGTVTTALILSVLLIDISMDTLIRSLIQP